MCYTVGGKPETWVAQLSKMRGAGKSTEGATNLAMAQREVFTPPVSQSVVPSL